MYRKNLARLFALSTLVALAACGGDAPDSNLDEAGAAPSPGFADPNAPVEVAPSVTEGAIIMDTTGVGASLTRGDSSR